MSIVSTENLTKNYGRRIGIRAVSLEILEGQIFGFLGPNGAGKTTMIRLLLGFLRPTAGKARIFGRDCWKESSGIKKDVGYLPGDLRLYPWLTGRTALGIVGRIRGMDLRRSGHELAARFSLEMNLPVHKMSRGMRQKLGLILALAHQPRLLILDEPTSGLDPIMQQRLAESLRESAAQGHTVFFSSHTLSEVEQLCDRVAIVRDGEIVADESLETLRSQARRSVSLCFADAETANSISIPEFLNLTSRNGSEWHCELVGSSRQLIRWAGEQRLEDLMIGPPDLESLFHRYYQPAGEVV